MTTKFCAPLMIIFIFCKFLEKPFISGTSEIDQIYKISSILGTPVRSDWQDGHGLATAMNFRFPNFKPTHLTSVLGPRSSARAVSLLYALLAWNPSWRSSAHEALRYGFSIFCYVKKSSATSRLRGQEKYII